MGILNVTPDSFSDGGQYADKRKAVARARQMVEEGADIIDVGGESSRPGSRPVAAAVEIRRVVPVVEYLRAKTDILISVDTRKSAVAAAALRAGAHIINDISALTDDPRMPEIVRQAKAGVVLMHKKGQPYDMQAHPAYRDVVAEVAGYLKRRLAALVKAGIGIEALALDPGLGFGKTAEHNFKLLANLGRLKKPGRPLVVGLSRKSFLGKITGRAAPARLAASLGAAAFCLLNGASVLRVHDVKETRDVLLVLKAIGAEKTPC